MPQAVSARWKPEVSASGWVAPAASRWWVREVAITEKIASPKAPPTHVEVLIRAAASPALSGGTPALAAVLTPTKTKPRPNDMIRSAGSRSPRYEPCTGMRESQYTAPEEIRAPVTMIGRVPMRANSCEAMPDEMATPAVAGREAGPACTCEKPSTVCLERGREKDIP